MALKLTVLGLVLGHHPLETVTHFGEWAPQALRVDGSTGPVATGR